MTPGAYLHHSAATNVHFMGVEPIPYYVLLPSVPTPGVSPLGAPRDLSSGNASFAASGSNTPLLPSTSRKVPICGETLMGKRRIKRNGGGS